MITIFCALYPEARGLIGAFQLKKENEQKHFQVFSDRDGGMRLVITGVGAVPAATAVAEISTVYPPGKEDFLVNFGSCGAAGYPVGELCLCNKITEVQTGRTYYPDMLYRHPFLEAEIRTDVRAAEAKQLAAVEINFTGTGQIAAVETNFTGTGQIAATGEKSAGAGNRRLYDMESAAVFQAGNYYYGPHQMLFLKVVTDNGVTPDGFSDEQFRKVMEQAVLEAVPFLQSFPGKEEGGKECLRQKIVKEAGQLGRALHCSASMQSELTQLLYYCALSGTDWRNLCPAGAAGRLLDSGQGEKPLAKDRREGKRILEELKAGLLQSQF